MIPLAGENGGGMIPKMIPCGEGSSPAMPPDHEVSGSADEIPAGLSGWTDMMASMFVESDCVMGSDGSGVWSAFDGEVTGDSVGGMADGMCVGNGSGMKYP